VDAVGDPGRAEDDRGRGALIEDVQLEASGEESDTWKFRVMDENGSFLTGVYLRYHQGKTSFTSSMHAGPDGISEVSLNRMHRTIFFDHVGYESEELDLFGRAPNELITVRLKKKGS
jgi:hypothetical protein